MATPHAATQHCLDGPEVLPKRGTTARLRLKNLLRDEHGAEQVRDVLAAYATFNPHLRLEALGQSWLPTNTTWPKWLPTEPTSPHWYTAEELAGLMAAYIADKPDMLIRDFLATFAGLTGTVKRKAVAEAAGLGKRPKLSDFVRSDGVDHEAVDKLLSAMREKSKVVPPAKLGVIGEDHLRHRLCDGGYPVSKASFKYAKVLGSQDGQPFVVETAFAWRPDWDRRVLHCGVNWAPTFGGTPFREMNGTSLDSLLADQECDWGDGIFVAVHVATPKPGFRDQGKGSLSLHGPMADAVIKAVKKVTKKWAEQKKAEKKDASKEAHREDRLTRSSQIYLTEVLHEVVPDAYAETSNDGQWPAEARQVMYKARPRLQELTGKQLDDEYFTQTLLPDFVDQNPELCADWDVVYDARGAMHEPHSGRSVRCGTLDVRHYVDGADAQSAWVGSVDAEIAFAKGLETYGAANRFAAVLFIEKEGFRPLFAAAGIAEEFDLAIMSTKGQPSTAARRLIDRLSLPVFALHDFNIQGFSIKHQLSHSNRRYRFENRIHVVDLGLRLDDVLEWGLEPEEVFNIRSHRSTLLRHGMTEKEADFLLSGRRVELNAFTSDQFVEFVRGKLRGHGLRKVVPDDADMAAAYRTLLARQRLQAVIDCELEAILADCAGAELPRGLREIVQQQLAGNPRLSWDAAMESVLARTAGHRGQVGDQPGHGAEA